NSKKEAVDDVRARDEETRFRAPGQRLDESIEKLRLRGSVLVVGELLGVVGHDLIQLGEFLLTQEAAHQATLSAHRGRTTARSTPVATAKPRRRSYVE